VVYISTFNGQPGVGQVIVYPAGLKDQNPSPIQSIQNGTARPDGMTVDSAGTLYVANIPQGYGGHYISEFHPGASSPFTYLTDQLQDPTDVAIAADGTLYVNQGQIGDQVGEYVTIFKPGKIKAARTVNLHFSGYAMSAEQMAFDTNGDLLVSANALNVPVHVFRMNTKTFQVSQVNLNVGTLDGPGLAVDRAGNIYVSGFYNGHIDIFAPGSTNPTRVINQGAQDMRVMPDGTLYASNGDSVDEYAPGGSSPVNVISAYDDQGFGLAVGPAH
jgi:sugar lactone lactonase YvrE